jgi:glutathione S-transferase
MAFEHATADYQSIHPKGLVPLLIDNGHTIYDSNDIIEYLDRVFPEIPLGHVGARGWLDLADQSQLALRTLSHELLLGACRRLDTDTLARFGQDHSNREFYQFLHRFSTEGFDDQHLAENATAISAMLQRLEEALSKARFLTGGQASLADFSWIVNVHRLSLIDFPLQRWPALNAWFGVMRERASYGIALTAFEGKLPPCTPAMKRRRERLFRRLMPNKN